MACYAGRAAQSEHSMCDGNVQLATGTSAPAQFICRICVYYKVCSAAFLDAARGSRFIFLVAIRNTCLFVFTVKRVLILLLSKDYLFNLCVQWKVYGDKEDFFSG